MSATRQTGTGPAQRAAPNRRRQVLAAGFALGTAVLVRPSAAAEPPAELALAMLGFTRGAPLRAGRVLLDIAALVDNGGAVPVTVRVDSPMQAADHVAAIALFSERNPQREIIVARLGPHNGRAELSTRIRLATSQKLAAVARMSDGSCWFALADVVVSIAACLEGDG